MGQITDMIPARTVHKFLRKHMKCKLLVVAISGTHAYGYPNSKSPLDLKGLHVEPTENIVGLLQPAKTYSYVEEYEGICFDYSSIEIGVGLERLLRGDGSILERIMAPRQVLSGEDLRRLQLVCRGVISRRFYNYYKNFSKGLKRETESNQQHSARYLLSVYRTALTGVHLFKTGKVVLDLMTLASSYGLSQIKELIELYQKQEDAVVEEGNPWVNRTVKLHVLLEEAFEKTKLPNDPDNPGAVETYLLDMRRRFFDAPTIKQDE